MKFRIAFQTPEQLNCPKDKYIELLNKLHESIGFEQLTSRLDIISLEWALNSGYHFEKQDDLLLFTHVSLK
jgi:hypothetical protein